MKYKKIDPPLFTFFFDHTSQNVRDKIIVILAKEEDKQKQIKNNNNKYKSKDKQLFKEYTISKPDKVVSWLLFLMVKGTYPTIKEKAIQLFDRLLIKKGKELIESMSKEIVNAVKAETIELLKTNHTDSYRQHLFSGWDELEPKFWMERIAQQIIDTIIKVLDNRNRPKEGLTDRITKTNMIKYLLVMAEMNPDEFTDTHIEILVTHLYEWLAQVKDISFEEWTRRKDSIKTWNDQEYPKDDQDDAAVESFEDFYHLNERRMVPTLKQFNIFLNSQQWKQRYAAIMSLHRYSGFYKDENFPTIINIKLVDDENIKVRWAILQFLIGLTKEFTKFTISFRKEIFQFIIKSIHHDDPNERIQNCCCILLESMIESMFSSVLEMFGDNNLKGLFNSFVLLLESPKLFVVESALESLRLVINIAQKKFRPVSIHIEVNWVKFIYLLNPSKYYRNIVSILFTLLAKHHSNKESRELCGLAIKAFSYCGMAIDRKLLFTRDLYKFMMFIKKNEKSLDSLIIDAIRECSDFIYVVRHSFSLYLPMIIKMIINLLDQHPSSIQKYEKRIVATLDGLDNLMVDSLQNTICMTLVELHFGDRSEEMFTKILESEFISCIHDTSLHVMKNRIEIGAYLIRGIGADTMTFNQVESVMDLFYKLETKLKNMSEELMQDEEEDPDDMLQTIAIVESRICTTVGVMIAHNGSIATPFITSELLEKICKKLRNIDVNEENANDGEEGDDDDDDDNDDVKGYTTKMQQPSEEFTEIIVILANKDHQQKQKTKQLFKEYSLSKPEETVVSWLLYLMINGIYPTSNCLSKIKEKSVQLLYRLLNKQEEGEEYIEYLSDEILLIVKVETIKLLNTPLTDTYRYHLFGIIEHIACYLVPRCKWNELEPSLESMINSVEEERSISSPLQENTRALMVVLSKYDFKKEKMEMLKEMIDCDIFYYLGDEQYRSYMPILLKMLVQIDTCGEFIKKVVNILDDFTVNDTPSWLKESSLQLVYTLKEILDGNQCDKITKNNVLHFFLTIVLLNPTDRHVEIVVSYLFKQMTLVKDVNLEEWTKNSFEIERDIDFHKGFCEEMDSGLLNTYTVFRDRDYDQEVVQQEDSAFDRFAHVFEEFVDPTPVCNQFNLFANSQSWKHRYSALVLLPKFYRYLEISQYQLLFILKLILKLADDKDMRVRCASLYCLTKMYSREFKEVMVESRQEIFQVIGKSICDNHNYFETIIPILFALLEKHHATNKSRLLCCRAVKTFAMCSLVVDKQTFSRYLFQFMMFIKKNQWSTDWIVDVLRASSYFIEAIGKSFSVYLPMIVKMIANILQETSSETHLTDQIRLSFRLTLKSLDKILKWNDESVYQPLAPFVQKLIAPLLIMAKSTDNNDNRKYSIDYLPLLLMLYKIQYGPSSDKTKEMFSKLLNLSLSSCPIHFPPRINLLGNYINMGAKVIKVIGNDTMTLDQIHSTLDTLNVIERKLSDIFIQAQGNQFIFQDSTPEEFQRSNTRGICSIYYMIGRVMKYNGAITTPLITFDQLGRACKILDDKQVHYEDTLFYYKVSKCVTIDFNIKARASIALGLAAQLGKDRFSPWAIDAVLALNTLASEPHSEYLHKQFATKHAITRQVKYVNCICMMEQPDEKFIEIVVNLAKEQENNSYVMKRVDNNNNSKYKSASKQQFIEHTISKPDKVVSWLLYLMVKGTFTTIKEKSVQLLDRLLVKKGKEFIESLSASILEAVKVETIELLSSTLTDSFRQHLFSIIESFANYLIPRGGWNDLEPKLEKIVDGEDHQENAQEDEEIIQEEEEVSPLKLNAKGLLVVLLKRRILAQMDGDVTRSEFLYISRHLDNNIFTSPKWMCTIGLQIVDTLVDVLNRNRERGSLLTTDKTNTRNNMFRYLLIMAESVNDEGFTSTHLESIAIHLYEWLSEVKEMPMEEWTSNGSKSGSKLFNLNYFTDKQSALDDYDDIVPEYNNTDDKKYTQEDQLEEAVKTFDQLAYLIGYPLKAPIFNHFNLFLKSQQWNQQYAALMSLSRFCDSYIMKQFPSILESISNCLEDENIRMRWASLYCLITLNIQDEFQEKMLKSRNQLFQVIAKSIRDPNERVQSICCILIQSLMTSLKKNMIVDNVLDGLCNSFEILLQSPTLFLAENVLIPLMSVIDTVKDRFRPYYPRFISILFKLLEKHHTTIESRVLCSRVIKTLALCGKVVDKKMTFTRDLNKFMVFFKKNTWSVDLVVDVFRTSGDFIEVIGKSFSIYLPMIIRMIINLLETTPFTNQLRVPEEEMSATDVKRVLSALKGLNRIVEVSYNGATVNNPLIPYAYQLVRPLCKLAMVRDNTDIDTCIQRYSLTNLPICVKLAYLHLGDRNDKKLEMFGMVINSVVFPSTLPSNTSVEVLQSRIDMAQELIDEMGGGAMTLDHAKTVMDLFYKVDKKLEVLADHTRNGNLDVVGDINPFFMLDKLAAVESRIYEMVGVLIKHNSDIVAPLITSDLLDKACDKLRMVPVKEDDDDDYDDNDGNESNDIFIIKKGILEFMAQYCEFGGESAIKSFLQIIPPIIECLEKPCNKKGVQKKASVALGVAAQFGKDRFSPWVMQVLHAFNELVSAPIYCAESTSAKHSAISSIGKIIRYVPQIASHASIIIPKWLELLPSQTSSMDINIIADNLCAIIRLYTKDCFGQQHQHVNRLFKIVRYYENFKENEDHQFYESDDEDSSQEEDQDEDIVHDKDSSQDLDEDIGEDKDSDQDEDSDQDNDSDKDKDSDQDIDSDEDDDSDEFDSIQPKVKQSLFETIQFMRDSLKSR
ncbi:hypothetical protein DFA_00489 [Cavenderia fasciculata]|uniref:Condensin complex subunit 1 C-terminal domain-containing protein n=1 Tax=Cavenderia fasciculata TaxID=261658 RepID=F4PS30_CACFS|nr:uncharacterized protein DFA_00489 [Cavenderia fasciculata]EGG20628.1 hypothetical protein DFA_00489 [Cavenderia fasciculata]|eukprot:XP_004358478.1 hypothetical protein DFA_00489 [Cavenderia fasciculata]